MKVVWRLEKATVRDVYEALRDPARHRLHHRDDDDEDPGREGLPQEDAGRPRLSVPPVAAAAAGRSGRWSATSSTGSSTARPRRCWSISRRTAGCRRTTRTPSAAWPRRSTNEPADLSQPRRVERAGRGDRRGARCSRSSCCGSTRRPCVMCSFESCSRSACCCRSCSRTAVGAIGTRTSADVRQLTTRRQAGEPPSADAQLIVGAGRAGRARRISGPRSLPSC